MAETTLPSYHCDQANENLSIEDMMDLIRYAPPGPWPDGWHGWANVHHAHVRLLDEFVSKLTSYPEKRFKKGRCIVSCVSAKPGHSSGKNLKHGYLPAAWVMVNELRRLGCNLPVVFAHLGPLEWSPRLTEIVAPLGVEVIDLRAIERRHPARILAGWESKAYAIQNSPYEEVLFLDADNVPVQNPEKLFEEPSYRNYGAIFWPDLPPYDRKEWLPKAVWSAIGLPYDPGVDFESGQLLINKRQCWKELAVTRWLNDHSDRYYRIVFGDKSTFRLGWAKMGTPYGLPQQAAGWNGGAIMQHDLQGALLFEHCAQNKPDLDGYPKKRRNLPACLTNSGECLGHLHRLRDLWDGQTWGSTGDEEDAAITESLIGKTFLYKRIGLGERPLRLLEDNRIGRGGARCEFGWAIQGGRLAVSDVDGRLTMVLDRRPDGVWVGNWEEHEKAAVEMVPQG